jgi:hypothetical protein
MGKSLLFQQKVMGNFTPVQTEILEEEDYVVEDEAAVPYEVIHIAAGVSPLSALNPAIQYLNIATNPSACLEENYLGTIHRVYHGSLSAQGPACYKESDTGTQAESKTRNVEIWQRSKSAARIGGVKGGIVGKRAAQTIEASQLL